MKQEIKEFFELIIFESGNFTLHVYHIFNALLVILIARLIMWTLRKIFKKRNKGEIDRGKVYAVLQILSYFVYLIAIIIIFSTLGLNITGLLVGSTALLVGLGLGLQDFFRDLVAGFIILWERTVTAGDIVEIDGKVGQIKDVGLRTTSLLTRDDIIIIVPNTKLTTDNVINWSQNNHVSRFRIEVGVAYGSDTEMVVDLLVKVAEENKAVLKIPPPAAQLTDFGDSALEFTLLFYSNNLFRIERIKSDLRLAIDKTFRENKVNIPFPQRDLWLRGGNFKESEKL